MECQGFLSSRPNRLRLPLSRKRVCYPLHPLWFQGGWTLPCGEGAGGANSHKGTYTGTLFSTIPIGIPLRGGMMASHHIGYGIAHTRVLRKYST
jgi:hypothetical protein